ncbi:hypothetical protein PHET_04849 [Paragonimus heterotremus]|uniref:Uncharacterized protein n=1 Tax=Paragonimus heterotremus TaxID=100268 RepID=A0A8J4WID3_9TREM|nr:hypothetical protein PHET_04849 [Paragonimus heterotremus]
MSLVAPITIIFTDFQHNRAFSAPLLALCNTHSFGRFTNVSQEDCDSNHLYIMDLRMAFLVCFVIALALASVATFLSATYLCSWHRSGYDTELMLYYRLSIITIFVLSGIIYQSAMFLLHVYYYQEKVLESEELPLNYANWPSVSAANTQIHYGASYFLFWTAMVSVYVAAYMFYFATVYSSNYYTECDLEELKPLDYKEQPSFPRFTVYEDGNVESIFMNPSPVGTSANTMELRSAANQSR